MVLGGITGRARGVEGERAAGLQRSQGTRSDNYCRNWSLDRESGQGQLSFRQKYEKPFQPRYPWV